MAVTFGAATMFTSCGKDEVEPTPAPDAVASFTYSGGNCDAPCDVTFVNGSTNATSYSWNFGDGGTSTEDNPSHTYASSGTFSVVLTATNVDGKANSFSSSVTINAATTYTKTQLLCDMGAWKCTALTCDPAYNYPDESTVGGQTDWFAYYMHSCEKDNVLQFNSNGTLLAENGAVTCTTTQDSDIWWLFITEIGASDWNFNISETVLTVDGVAYTLETLSSTTLKYRYAETIDGTNITVTVTLTH